jgi:hypothetical protein
VDESPASRLDEVTSEVYMGLIALQVSLEAWLERDSER